MNSFSRLAAAPATAGVSAAEVAKRKPVRVTLTISWATHQRLLERSNYEGRSLSNLCAYMLELELGSPPADIAA
jgi:hypothetical protein